MLIKDGETHLNLALANYVYLNESGKWEVEIDQVEHYESEIPNNAFKKLLDCQYIHANFIKAKMPITGNPAYINMNRVVAIAPNVANNTLYVSFQGNEGTCFDQEDFEIPKHHIAMSSHLC
jgi:hypothetical protein